MPTNKNASLRYKVLDKCFRNKFRKYTIYDLVDEVTRALKEMYGESASISRRMIQNDIGFMRSEAGYFAPVECIREGQKVYYRYTDPSFSIFNQPLTGEELSAVREMYHIISGISGRIEYKFLKDILIKLDKDIQKDKKDEDIIISYEENRFLKNLDGLGLLFMAIKTGQPLEVKYKPYNEKAKKMIIHPYFLKQYNNRWFLFALHEKSKEQGIHPVNFALDRFEKIENSNIEYIPNTDIDFQNYFKHIIGVTKPLNTPVTKISFVVSDELKPYLETKPLHHSQAPFKKYKKWYRSSIYVIPNYEMYSSFLSFGADLIVISPQSVVEEMKRITDIMNKNYF